MNVLKNLVYADFGSTCFSRKKNCHITTPKIAAVSEFAVKALKYFNSVGIFKNDDIWFPAYYTLNDLWNFTDASRKLCLVSKMSTE